MDHAIKIVASSPDDVSSAAQACNATGYSYFPVGSGVVGLLRVGSLSQRRDVRQLSNVYIIPHHSSSKDVSKLLATLGIKSGKTARELHAAIFSAIDVDEFDPDL